MTAKNSTYYIKQAKRYLDKAEKTEDQRERIILIENSMDTLETALDKAISEKIDNK